MGVLVFVEAGMRDDYVTGGGAVVVRQLVAPQHHNSQKISMAYLQLTC
jgi:hypothetical protein